ncbi:NAD-dependent deacylase [Aestuariibius sp. 2305UL40-4]|uniref:NAD-dependent deacylase n=1 Tax=Aestuariibius violaceus TaxID=3234132 RepID=UPI00345E43D8
MTDRIVILTGAGLSAESGLDTFRSAGGVWSQVRLEDVATPEAFARDPARVHAFYNARRQGAAAVDPNAAHKALARLQKNHPGAVTIVTQNVDSLHEAAGAQVIHMHGQLDQALCAACNHRWPAPIEMQPHQTCPNCGQQTTRPDIVWFGEIPYHMERIDAVLSDATLFAAIGTSGQVYPAAGFVEIAAAAGARTIELTLEPSAVSQLFDETDHRKATEAVPAWVDRLLAG